MDADRHSSRAGRVKAANSRHKKKRRMPRSPMPQRSGRADRREQRTSRHEQHTSLAEAMNAQKKRTKHTGGQTRRSSARPRRAGALSPRNVHQDHSRAPRNRHLHSAGSRQEPQRRIKEQVHKPQPRRLTPRERALLEERQAKHEQRMRLLKKVVLWIAILAIIAGATWYAGHLIRNSLDEIHQATAKPDPADAYREIPCNEEILSGVLSKTATYAGKPVSFTQTLKNSHKKRACYVDAGRDYMYVKVTSGDQLVWDSQMCEVGDASRELLIGAGREGTVDIQWPGIVAGEDCAGADPAQPGTYVVQFYWNEQPFGEKQVFELAAEPPKPAPKPEDASQKEDAGEKSE